MPYEQQLLKKPGRVPNICVEVDLLHQEPARTVGDPFTAYVPGEVTQVSRMTDVHPKFLDKSPR